MDSEEKFVLPVAESQAIVKRDPESDCALCLEVLHAECTPRALPCLHTFCHNCLEQYLEHRQNPDGTYPCPTCREVTIML